MLVASPLLTLGTVALCQQSYVYSPRPVASGETFQKSEGILVREVGVKKGDTLYGLSRTSSGRGSYYPQILLFNEIKNPDLIFPGDVLRIPVATDRLQASKEGTGAGRTSGHPVPSRRQQASARHHPAQQVNAVSKPLVPTGAAAGPKLFEQAIAAYRREDCRTALKFFDRFLAANPSSPLAADATLYSAECYLKQSDRAP